jgi:hypothetical protein
LPEAVSLAHAGAVTELPDLPLKPANDEPPPVLGSWRRVYVAVLCYLLFLVVALYAITRLFRY